MPETRSNNAIAVDAQDKYERYMLALTFTVLGLSIQTAHFGVGGVAAATELLAWVCLFVSGLVGLSRWEKTPGLFDKYHAQDEAKGRAMSVVQTMRDTDQVHAVFPGTTMTAKEALAVDKELVARLDTVLKKANASLARLYVVQKRLFLGGLGLLIVARAYAPLRYLITVGCTRFHC